MDELHQDGATHLKLSHPAHVETLCRRLFKDSPIGMALVEKQFSTKALVNEMSSEENAKKYGDKVVQTFGRIIAIDGSTITLGDGVVVNLMDSNPELEKGDSITVKGRCIGYDDLLGEVKLDQATIIQE